MKNFILLGLFARDFETLLGEITKKSSSTTFTMKMMEELLL
jgi:hypothetical protein